jgi:hypothetical protein
VKVSFLQAMASHDVAPQLLHPGFRRQVVDELDSGDAAVSFWARQALAHLLGVDADETGPDALRTQWLAIGDWEADPERS